MKMSIKKKANTTDCDSDEFELDPADNDESIVEMESKGEEKDLKAAAQPDEVGKQSGHLIADLGDNHEVHWTIRNDEVDLLPLVDELYLAECERDDLGSITINDVHRAVAQRLGLGDKPLDKKRKKLVKGRLMDLITREASLVAPSIVPVKDIDILTMRTNCGNKIEYKYLGGNVWLKQV
jgi:hypothetical protein